MEVCIGIISYLPAGKEIREERIKRINSLIEQCDSLYNLPIIIVAQNWNPQEVKVSKNCSIFHYNKLGITGARKELRKLFLFSRYDYLIMLDDDMELADDKQSAKRYLGLILNQPKVYEYKNYLLNMFGIPKYIFEQIDFDNIEAEKGEGFEDWIFVNRIQNQFKKYYYNITNLNLLKRPRSELVEDKYSTWLTPSTNKEEMTEKSLQRVGKKEPSQPRGPLFC